MLKNTFIIVNPKSYKSNDLINYLNSKNLNYEFSYNKDNLENLMNKIKEGYTKFVICGGDGTINKFINAFMKIPQNFGRKVSVGIIPCGRANDLARVLKIPFNMEKAFKIIEDNRTEWVDLIKVNDSYFITGGGLGLPAEIVNEVNNIRFMKRIMGESIYFWITLKKFIFGYRGIEEINDKLLAIYVLNQSFIGKRFNIAPEAKNNDGYFDVKFVKTPPTFLSNFKTLFRGSKGEIDELSWVMKKKTNKLTINLKRPSYFMGDGELLEENNKFNIEVIPNAINIFC
tara:strand:- start:937 stop:1794 length:858 start_codon:yes stop_codon:yes gene_type:complete